MAREWREIYFDYEWAQLFAGRMVVTADARAPEDAPLDADLFWTLDNGTILAMKKGEETGYCDTCAGYASECYYALTTEEASHVR